MPLSSGDDLVKRFIGRCAGCLLLTLLCLLSLGPPVQSFTVSSWYEQRWSGIHKQITDVSCGPASVVTLLNTYYGMDVNEMDVYQIVLSGRDDLEDLFESATLDEPTILWNATNMSDLIRSFEYFGFQAVGLIMTSSQLISYFANVGLPLIAHITRPQVHFFLVIGMIDDDHFVIADPSQGTYVMSGDELIRGSSGYFLAHVPPVPIDSVLLKTHVENAALRMDKLRKSPMIAGKGGVW